jgi:hypothetical protein
MRNSALWGFSLLTLGSVGYNVYQQDQLKTLSAIKDLAVQKDAMMSDGYNEIMFKYMTELKENDREIYRGQGRIEGILSVVNNFKPKDNEHSAVWHEGYYKGLAQMEEVRKASYEEGYHKATEDMNCPANLSTK